MDQIFNTQGTALSSWGFSLKKPKTNSIKQKHPKKLLPTKKKVI